MLEPENNRRFSGVKSLYGEAKFLRLIKSHVVVVGIGGVGSWCCEAIARSGIGKITLIDMDVVSESNTNRQIHALTGNYGKDKVFAMKERLLLINPNLQVCCIDQFLNQENCDDLLSQGSENNIDALIDASDQVSAKISMILWAKLHKNVKFITVGAAGGKLDPTQIKIDDLANCYQDPLLARIRSKLRREYEYPSDKKKMNVNVVFSTEQVKKSYSENEKNVINKPLIKCLENKDDINEMSNLPQAKLACSGYGSSVTVTASFGFSAASWAINQL